MQLILARHGETLYNRENVFRGTLEVPLNPQGERQAELLSAALKRENPGAVYSSPQLRALATARAIAEPHGLTPQTEPRLADMDFGEWQGKAVKEVAENYPELFAQWETDPYRLQIPGAGGFAGVEAGLSSLLGELEERYPRDTVVLVTHRLVIKMLLVLVLGLPRQGYWQLRPDPASITRLEKNRDLYVLTGFNETGHLREEDSRLEERG